MKNQNEPHCLEAEKVVSYVYGELAADETASFERHAASCAACADDVAGFGAARMSIGDWKSQFDLMPTPLITIPPSKERAPALTGGFSVFDQIRALFGGLPAFAAGTFAVALIAIGVFAYFATRESSTEVAGGNQNRAKAVTSPTANPTTTAKQTTSQTESLPEQTERTETLPAPVKISDKRTVTGRTPRTRKAAVTEAKKDRNKTPTLIDETDTEDDSLRLADLFDEIGTESSLR